MNQDDIYTALRRKLQSLSAMSLDSLAPDQPFISTGLIDSLSIVDLVQFVEDHYQVVVDPMDLSVDNFGTMAAIIDFVRKKSA